MSATTQSVTAEQLLTMPSDGFRYALVKGELRKMSPSGFDHGVIIGNITGPLQTFVNLHRLGVVCGAETGFLLARQPDTVLAPDVAFVKSERIAERTQSFWAGAPDLVVEVVSPHDAYVEVEEKVAAWLSFGALLVWLVNSKRRTVTVHRTGQAPRTITISDTLDGEDVIPGFRLAVSTIFA